MRKPLLINGKDASFEISDIEAILSPDSGVIAKGSADAETDFYFIKADCLWKASYTNNTNEVKIVLIDGSDIGYVNKIAEMFEEEFKNDKRVDVIAIADIFSGLVILQFFENFSDTSTIKDNAETTTEHCPYCDEEVELDAELKVQVCPNCGKHIVTCSMCIPVCERMMNDAGLDPIKCTDCVLCHQAKYLNTINS